MYRTALTVKGKRGPFPLVPSPTSGSSRTTQRSRPGTPSSMQLEKPGPSATPTVRGAERRRSSGTLVNRKGPRPDRETSRTPSRPSGRCKTGCGEGVRRPSGASPGSCSPAFAAGSAWRSRERRIPRHTAECVEARQVLASVLRSERPKGVTALAEAARRT